MDVKAPQLLLLPSTGERERPGYELSERSPDHSCELIANPRANPKDVESGDPGGKKRGTEQKI